MTKKQKLIEIIVKAGFLNMFDFVKNTESFTGKQRSNALVFAHLKNGCYDIRQLRAYAKDLKITLEEAEALFDVQSDNK